MTFIARALQVRVNMIRADAGLPPVTLHQAVTAIFVRWSPDQEVDPGYTYDLDVLAICDDPNVSETLNRRVADVGRSEVAAGVTVTMAVQRRNETAL